MISSIKLDGRQSRPEAGGNEKPAISADSQAIPQRPIGVSKEAAGISPFRKRSSEVSLSQRVLKACGNPTSLSSQIEIVKKA
jgi:hypothetical protein